MFKNTPFDAIAKSMTEGAPKFDASAMQDAFKPMQDNLKAWGELAQSQAQAAQASIASTVESFKNVKAPQEAFEVMKQSAESSVAMATQNLRDVTALSVAQFHAGIDAMEKVSPAPELFAKLGESLKAASSTMESTLDSALNSGAAVVASAKPTASKKSRAA